MFFQPIDSINCLSPLQSWDPAWMKGGHNVSELTPLSHPVWSFPCALDTSCNSEVPIEKESLTLYGWAVQISLNPGISLHWLRMFCLSWSDSVKFPETDIKNEILILLRLVIVWGLNVTASEKFCSTYSWSTVPSLSQDRIRMTISYSYGCLMWQSCLTIS